MGATSMRGMRQHARTVTAIIASCLTTTCSAPNECGGMPLMGQWVWTPRDAQLYREVQRQRPSLVAGVWVATIAWRHDSLAVQLGAAPLAHAPAQQMVVRLDDSVRPLWTIANDSLVAERLTSPLTRILAVAGRSPMRPLQLDYDVSVRLLPRWARVLHLLRRGVLADRTVWITSLVSHIESPDYGSLFRDAVDGHIVQLFDTGDTFTPASARRLQHALARAEMPFMVGVGTFERSLSGGRTTMHRAWLDELPALATIGTYRGLWFFPAGIPYSSYLPRR